MSYLTEQELALRELALSATPGPWTATNYMDYEGKHDHWYLDTNLTRADYVQNGSEIEPNHWDEMRAASDIKFIAAANPEVILNLLNKIEDLTSMVKGKSR